MRMLAVVLTLCACTRSSSPTLVGACVDAGADTSAVVAVTAGSEHACALRRGGTVWCWGDNAAGQLGDGTVALRSRPVQVVGLAGVVAVVAGWRHTCAIAADRGVWCWGAARSPAFAGDDADPTPVRVPDVQADELAAGSSFTCARTGGHVRCWGHNSAGELGNGGNAAATTPTDVIGIDDAVQIAAGAGSACARRRDGRIACWGRNVDGELGGASSGRCALGQGVSYDGKNVIDCSTIPITVNGVDDAVDVAVGWSTACALRRSSDVTCWGKSLIEGQTSREPMRIAGVRARRLAMTSRFACAIDGDAVWCWGEHERGQLGPEPGGAVRRIAGIAATQIAPGSAYACALDRAGGVRCWGDNRFRQLGNGHVAVRHGPVSIALPERVRAAAIGNDHLCALGERGQLWCWGDNARGQLGHVNGVAPARVALVGAATEVGAGVDFTCALLADRSVWCWGANDAGQLGVTGGDRRMPVRVGVGAATQLSVAARHACVLLADRGVMCWGANDKGQVDPLQRAVEKLPPTRIANVAGIATIAAGDHDTCALDTGGSARCWGDSYFSRDRDKPGPISRDRLARDVVSLHAGPTGRGGYESNICAVLRDGSVTCEGALDPMHLSMRTRDGRPVLERAPWTPVSAIAIGAGYACGIGKDDRVLCWGSQSYDAPVLGLFADSMYTTPTPLFDVPPARSVHAGRENTCVVTLRGELQCWGTNAHGELATGTAGMQPQPSPMRFGAAGAGG